MFAAMSHDNFTENENDVDGSRSKYKTCYQVEGGSPNITFTRPLCSLQSLRARIDQGLIWFRPRQFHMNRREPVTWG